MSSTKKLNCPDGSHICEHKRRRYDCVNCDGDTLWLKKTKKPTIVKFELKIKNRVNQLIDVQQEGLILFEKKNKDYGDAFAEHGPIGVLIRIGDKISRLQSITKSGINLIKTESIRDTLLDLHNYAAMAVMLLDHK